MPRYFVETTGFGRIVCEYVEAESAEEARRIVEERHGVSVKVKADYPVTLAEYDRQRKAGGAR